MNTSGYKIYEFSDASAWEGALGSATAMGQGSKIAVSPETGLATLSAYRGTKPWDGGIDGAARDSWIVVDHLGVFEDVPLSNRTEAFYAGVWSATTKPNDIFAIESGMGEATFNYISHDGAKSAQLQSRLAKFVELYEINLEQVPKWLYDARDAN